MKTNTLFFLKDAKFPKSYNKYRFLQILDDFLIRNSGTESNHAPIIEHLGIENLAIWS